ncbi:MAG TPA: hypothetical protein VF789_24055 [Thermoanaerobaculia bacterium]
MDAQLPRVILVTRKTPLELLLERHGTLSQARFYLESRGQTIEEYIEVQERFAAALGAVQQAIPPDQRRARVDRDQLDRFLFAPDDVVVVVGQDGLVPNAAKYLNGQLTIGVNPDPEHYDGVLCRHPPAAASRLLAWTRKRDKTFKVEQRTMALARREDGQELLALNEIFVGHQTHQSARYRIVFKGKEERQSSSGVICSTGTGSTGWARSISLQRDCAGRLPKPEDRRLFWMVREPFPSVDTQTTLSLGGLRYNQVLELRSEMAEGGVIFADGIEADRVEFLFGHVVTIGIAPSTLNLVVPDEGGSR